MTYDPNADRRNFEDRSGMSGSAMAGIALVLALFVGVMIWAFTGDRQTASTTNSPPTTTGQRARHQLLHRHRHRRPARSFHCCEPRRTLLSRAGFFYGTRNWA